MFRDGGVPAYHVDMTIKALDILHRDLLDDNALLSVARDGT